MTVNILKGKESIQGTDEWLEWRKTKITASEMPIIMGKSPWCTPYTLWRRKLGFEEEQKSNFAMQKGNRLEPIIRQEINTTCSRNFQPCVVENNCIEWVGASLDGYDEETNTILEIKCPNIDDHKEALNGNVPKKYFDQVQWQLFCSNANYCLYASHHEESSTKIVVYFDEEYFNNEMLPAAKDFYRCLTEMIEPEKNEDDITQIIDDRFGEIAAKWKVANKIRIENEKIEKSLKAEMVEFTDDSNCQGFGVRLTRVSRDGDIDYKKFLEDLKTDHPEIASKYDLESYRKPQIGYWKVSNCKE